jgi:putative transposase
MGDGSARRDDASMAHTYASNFIHCIFSTKERQPLIPADRKTALFNYLGGIAKSEGFSLLAAGGTSNHVHLLLILPVTNSLANVVQKLKGSSSRWMGPSFSWQEGYGAFSVSPSQVPVVKKYIRNQEQHHRNRSFEDEFTALLQSCGIEFDTRFVFG